MRQPENKFDKRDDTVRPNACETENIIDNKTKAVTVRNPPNQVKTINSELNSKLYIPKIQSLQALQAKKQQDIRKIQTELANLAKSDVHMTNSVRPNTVRPNGVRQVEKSINNNNQQNADNQTVKKKKKANLSDIVQLKSGPQLPALPEARNKSVQPDKSDIANLFLTPEEQAEIIEQSYKKNKKNEHTRSFQKIQEIKKYQEIEENKIIQDKQKNQKNINIQNVKDVQNPQNIQNIYQTQTIPRVTAQMPQTAQSGMPTQTFQKIRSVQPVQPAQPVQKVEKAEKSEKTEKSEKMINKTEKVNKSDVSETPQKAQKKIHPVKRLKNKFRKNGLNIIDSYFNAYFFYYIWKGEKKGRKVKESLNTVANHPVAWSADTSNDSVYEKNVYDKYISYMTSLSKFVGVISWIFSPVRNFFSLIGGLFRRPENENTENIENTENLRKESEKLKNISELAKKTAGVVLPAASIVFTILTIINISAYKPETELWLNGEKIGLVQSRQILTAASSLVETNVSALINEPYEFSGSVKYKVVLTKNPFFVSESELYNIIYNDAQNSITSAYGLYIDGKFIGAALKDSDINDALSSVLQANTDENADETVEFDNDIKIVPQKYSKLDIVTEDEIKNIINTSVELAINVADNTDSSDISDTSGSENTAVSSLSNSQTESAAETTGNSSVLSDKSSSQDKSDTASDTSVQGTGTNEDIAAAAASALNLTDDDAMDTIPRGLIGSLASTNDSGILARLAKTSASVSPDLLQLKKVKTETYTTTIPFEVKYIQSDKYYVGTQTVQTQGSNGQKKTIEQVTYVGSAEVSREIKNVETVTNPVNRIILVGNKPKPAAAVKSAANSKSAAVSKSLSNSNSVPVMSGRFVRPVSGGYVTSRFGQGGHRGIDLVVPYGSPIYAADGGTVVRAGYDGSYGNYVKIQHKNGLTTLYAHMSSILVNTGDSVSQGQVIGKVGSTGNSTGPHLHFEVAKNGSLVNPESYGIH